MAFDRCLIKDYLLTYLLTYLLMSHVTLVAHELLLRLAAVLCNSPQRRLAVALCVFALRRRRCKQSSCRV